MLLKFHGGQLNWGHYQFISTPDIAHIRFGSTLANTNKETMTQISDMINDCVIASHQIILLCYSLARLLYVQNDDRDIYRYRDFQQDLGLGHLRS